ncbi:MAG: dienelactone hydrolase family protein [Candidatus Eremiobacteraeota bacterium]|nr:dienelactone hydrolase family protein [Candidatus Eremiobacteraeota bacterium]
MPAWLKIVAASGMLVAGTFLAGVPAGFVALPLVRIPPPSGAWAIGTVTLPLPAEEGASTARIWYPASPGTRGRRARYTDGAMTFRNRVRGGIVTVDAFVAAPVAPGRFPIVFYVPGWSGARENNTAQAENLASNGYVVVALDDADPQPPMDFTTQAALDSAVAAANRKLDAAVREIERVTQLLDVLDAAPNGRFTGRLDTRHIGVLGFSFGGAVAAEAARRDPRIGAAIDLDGWLFGEALRDGVPRPFMILGTAYDTPTAAVRDASPAARELLRDFDRDNDVRTLAGLRRFGGLIVTIDGTDHNNFSDAAWLPTFHHRGLGPIDGRRGWSIAATAILQFFDRSLRGRPAPFFEPGARRDGAVRVRSFASGDALAKPPFR